MKIDGNVIELRGAETTIDVDAPLRIKDGASFVDVRNYIAPVFQYENLVVKNNTGTPNSQIDVSWDSLYIGPIRSTTYTQTLNIESDTDWDSGDHTDEPADGWVYIHAFAKADGTEVCKFSLSATAPTLPTDYMYSRLISAARNTSGNFLSFYQTGNIVNNASIIMVTGGTSSPGLVDVSAIIPHAIIKSFFGYIDTSGSTVLGKIMTPYLRTTHAVIGAQGGYCDGFYSEARLENAVLVYSVVNPGSVNIYCNGYILNI